MKPILIHSLLVILLLEGEISRFRPVSGQGLSKIHPELQKKVDSAPTGSTWDIFVAFKKDPNLFSSLNDSGIEEEFEVQGYKMMRIMDKDAEESQRAVVDVLNKMSKARNSGKELTYRTVSITNDLYIRNAWKELIYGLADTKKSENANITDIVEDQILSLPTGQFRTSVRDLTDDVGEGRPKGLADAWGLEKINAPAWWAKSFNGSGVIIGHIDNGVDIYHPSLKWNWVGRGAGWNDYTKKTFDIRKKYPYALGDTDDDSHGTHTLGILVGRGRKVKGETGKTEDGVEFYGSGVAPGARWMTCKACNGTRCRLMDILDCAKGMMCPNYTYSGRCLYKPNIVSMSLGCPQTQSFPCGGIRGGYHPYETMINTMEKANIILVFAADNNGKRGCGTIQDPADSVKLLGVGNVDINDTLHETSSKGPIIWRYGGNDTIFKPDLVAPGTDILSTIYSKGGRFYFGERTGTSFAAPHVAGAIALLLSRTEGLGLDQIKKILFNTSVPNTKLKTTNPTEYCGFGFDTDLQNHKFGYGRLRLPELNDSILPAEKRPTRMMPPPPDYSDLPDPDGAQRPGMAWAAVIMMTVSTVFLRNP